ncbi:MAG: hypothetical protein EXR99_04710 [Gemmataceae bacterium]|nr:hypothetical protein [Gemmataceae bacterium]
MIHQHNRPAKFFAWIAIGSIIFANVPHVSCRCPDGTIKEFCFYSPSVVSPPCCQKKLENNCCSSKPASGKVRQEKTSCWEGECENDPSPALISSFGATYEMGEANCQRLLAHPEAQAVSGSENKLEGLLKNQFQNVWTLVENQFQVNNSLRRTCQIPRQPPPPIDLLSLLQRFII